MGFGFNFFFIGIVVPVFLGVLLLLLLAKKEVNWIRVLAIGVSILVLPIFLLKTLQFFFSKKTVDKTDIYGEYVIDRNKYPGKQADWQYDHFRFEVTAENQFLFHQTEKERIVRTDTGTVRFVEVNNSPRINLQVSEPRHHIIEASPTLYRTTWSFYYVFKSSKFGNVFFTKGKWKPIDV